MRRLLILIHRYLGIGLSLLFAVWFISGIAMIYAKGMPNLTPQLRLQRLAELRPDSIRIASSVAVQKAGLDRPPARVILSSVAGRPVFRIGSKTVFADDGELMSAVDATAALEIAAAFTGISRDRFQVTLQTEADQWTISQRRQMPLHKITVDDPQHTQLYISPQSGEVIVMTTRAGRALAWVAAIPHWLYFTSLRVKVKEIEFTRIQGEPYYMVRTTDKRLVVSAETVQLRTQPFTADSLMNLVANAYPNVPILESQLLTKYDSYYYSQEGALPLPVLRVKFADKDRTWFYLDPETSQLVRTTHRLGRINRWIYHGLHSLDFSFWYYNRPAWDAGMIVLSLGGAATSIIGVYLGIRRLRRGARRVTTSYAG